MVNINKTVMIHLVLNNPWLVAHGERLGVSLHTAKQYQARFRSIHPDLKDT